MVSLSSAWRSQPLHQGTFSGTSRLLSPPSSNHPISLQKKGDLEKSSRGQGQPALSRKPDLYAWSIATKTDWADFGPLWKNVKSFPSNSTEGYLASLKQVDPVHSCNSSGQTKRRDSLDRRYQELLEQVRLLDTEAFQLKKEGLVSQLQEAYAARTVSV